MSRAAHRARSAAVPSGRLLASLALLAASTWACHANLRFDDLTSCADDGDCVLPSLHCSSGRCVGCASDAHCPTAGLPRCDPLLSRCIECGVSSDCTGGRVCKSGRCWQPCAAGCPASAPRCDDGACVQCDEGMGCASAATGQVCVGHVCGTCAGDAECGGATPRCDPVAHACVACQDNADCPTAGAPLCDIAAGRCVAMP